jgi:2-haloacid dehalogenase
MPLLIATNLEAARAPPRAGIGAPNSAWMTEFGVQRMKRLNIEAVVFDLLTALLDSWSVWRRAYLELTYGCGAYRPYEDLVREAAEVAGVPVSAAEALTAHWNTLRPWPEVPEVLGDLNARSIRLGVVTNCSITLGRQAAERVGVPFSVVVTSEETGYYKPQPQSYRAALDRLGTDPARTLFVAGSPADIPGAAGVGMPVFWHNRAGLPFVADKARPLLIADTLHPLGELV